MVRLRVQDAGNGIVDHVVREVLALVTPQSRRDRRLRRLAGGRHVYEHRDAHHVEVEHVGIVRNLQVLAVVGEVDQGGGCVLTLDAGDECGEEVVVVADGIVVLVDGGAGLGREVRLGVGQRVVEASEEVEVGGVAVFIPDVTAHEVKYDQFRAIAGGGQGLLEGRQEDAVGGLAGGEVDGVIGQLQEGVVAG